MENEEAAPEQCKKKILIAPDKFKGTIDAAQICDLIEKQVLPCVFSQTENLHIDSVPLSDGGDGFVECIYKGLSDSELIKLTATGPMGEVRNTEYCYNQQTSTAYIEVANISGLRFVKTEDRNPYVASSKGVGELIKNAYELGAKHIFVGAGGSAFNDIGIGALSALGLKFYDINNNILNPNLENLKNAVTAKWDKDTEDILENISVTFACDVTNPLLGTRGCTYIFGPQKGVKPDDLDSIDNLLSHLINLMKQASKYDRSNIENETGSGASGGIVAGFSTFFLNCNKVSGIEMISKHTGLLEKLHTCDLLITGEGKFDLQTFDGKVISYLLSSIQTFEGSTNPKSTIILCGACDVTEEIKLSLKSEKNVMVINLSELYGLKESMENPSECIKNGLLLNKEVFLF